jgi:hypothetical protein
MFGRATLAPNLALMACMFVFSLTGGAPKASSREDISAPRDCARRPKPRTATPGPYLCATGADSSCGKQICLNASVVDLRRQNFRIFDNGVEQKISEFFMEEAPCRSGWSFDASNSMRKKIDDSRQALTQFLRMSTPGDEFSLWKFSDRPETVCPLTRMPERLKTNSLQYSRAAGHRSSMRCISH